MMDGDTSLQVVPIYSAVSWPNMDWIHYLDLWERLSPDMKRVGELVGVEERFLIRAMRGTISVQTEKQVIPDLYANATTNFDLFSFSGTPNGCPSEILHGTGSPRSSK